MRAKDIMTTNVITVSPETPIREIAQRLLRHHISALPVVNSEGGLVGIVSEADLMHRAETGTERHRRGGWRSWPIRNSSHTIM